ncbi:type I secretion system permease/ATPase [Desulforhopalus singaporensis]|uniref:ATP-binding cassette, subfamily C, LapB n=1 Tax=Desulforhopalus singaporensis TaxID=91360 RepID=A0A1H0MXK5_9BACT|nr:type I secretion system permease/ATPase [Desulforhopalus singaporensis]SDO84850.1 ATP-binding cassette, subfamily C, LapB [Desulforhopalus singaporensis]
MNTKIVGKTKEKKWDLRSDSDVIDDPLTDCLVIMAKLHGRPVSRTTLRAGLPLVNNRLTVQLVNRAAQRMGMISRIIKRPLARLTNLEIPCILLLKDNRAAVMVGINKKARMITLVQSESGAGERVVPVKELEEQYSGYAVFVQPEFLAEDRKVTEMTGKRGHWFWGPVISSWRIYRDVILASFLINLFGLASPFFILNVYDRVIPNKAFETLWVLATGITVVYLFSMLMQGLRGYFVEVAGKKANLEMSAVIFEKVLGLKMSSRPESIGSFSNKIQQFDSVRDFITSLSITALVDLPFMVLALIAIWYLAGVTVVIHVSAIVLLLTYALFIQLPLQHAVEQTYHASARKNAVLVEGLNGLETLKMLGAEGKIQRTWEESVGHISKWSSRSRFLSTSVSHLSSFVQGITVVAVVITGVYIVAQGEMSQGGLIAVVILTRQAVAPMVHVVSLATRYNRAKTAIKTLQQVMEMPGERPANKNFLHRAGLKGAIEFKEVSFTYPDQGLPVLKNISLKIAQGEKVGIIGTIGSGKTTLGKLMLGLYEPDSGMVAIDGTDIRQIDPTELRRFIGCVPQDVTLFRGSVRDNIVMGCDIATDSDIIRAAELSGASDIVGRHPMGFDMPVGEQGRALSGGQRQVVAMARALLLDPPVQILDEPSSHMDAKTEAQIRRRLATIIRNKTLILISHRASLLAMVDRLIVIDNGNIVADGKKDKILEALKSGQINV